MFTMIIEPWCGDLIFEEQNMASDKQQVCECCHNKAKEFYDGVGLCGVHNNQLKRKFGWPHSPFWADEMHGITRKQVRRSFGFIFPEAEAS